MERRRKANSSNEDLSAYTFPVGQVVGFHALAGDVKVRPSTNSPELLSEVSSVRVQYDKGMAPAEPVPVLQIGSIKLDRKLLLIRFEGYLDRTSVEHLEGALLFAREDELLPLEEEEFWVSDLVGLSAYTTKGELVGTICSIIPSATDVLEITPVNDSSGKKILVPFVKKLVPKVSLEQQRIEIEAIPGLLEPQ